MTGGELREIRHRLDLTQAAMASQLGVAPNTVARWERGERPIPEPAEQVARRLFQQRSAKGPSIAGLDATRLQEWSRRRDAEGRLPQLIRRLAHATLDTPNRIDFPAGDSVQLGGWDGVIEVDSGNFIVPDGRSAWELSTNARPRPKADDDYRKRKRDPGFAPSETTFVFATSRRWTKKDEWAKAKRREGFWDDVRAYDADDIEQWLERAPGVRVWAAKLLGVLPPTGVMVVEQFWEEWAAGTSLTPATVLAGRRDASDWLVDQLAREPSVVSIESDSTEEAACFVAASLLAVKGEVGTTLRARTLVVSDTQTWRALVGTQERLILIPTESLDPTVIPAAAAQGHHALVAAVGSAAPPSVQLPPLNRDELRHELVQTGMEQERARQIAAQSGRRASVLRRLLSQSASLLAPAWASGDGVRELAPLLLAGSWDESAAADRDALQALGRRPYDDLAELVLRCTAASDPPLWRHRTVWTWVSRIDSWNLLRDALGRSDLEAFQPLAIDVLGDSDPRYDLPPEKRWAFGVYGQRPRYSRALRHGIAQTVALLGARSEGAKISDATIPEVRANSVVQAVLRDQNWKRWASLSDVLTDLAEAAPVCFFQALDDLPDEDVKTLLGQDEGIFGGAPHVSLLWSLECLAWKSEYLTRATRALGRLARLDPGGQWSNRPHRSLREIFVGWRPQTTASQESRLLALDDLLEVEPSVGWALLLDLVPGRYESASPTHKPRWHNWLAGWSASVTRGEYQVWGEEIYRRVLCHVTRDVSLFAGLIDQLSNFPEPFLTQAIDVIEQHAHEIKQAENNADARQKLRHLVHDHRRFSDTDWSLPDPILTRLTSVYEHLDPDDIVERHRWLFSGGARLLQSRGTTYEERTAEQDSARRDAIREIMNEGGVAFVVSMATEVEHPDLLGRALGSLEPDDDIEADFLSKTLGSEDSNRRTLGLGFVSATARHRGAEWVRLYLGSASTRDLTSTQIADFACALPFEPTTWTLSAQSGQEVDELYWKRTHTYWSPQVVGSHFRHAIGKLLGVSRPFAALDLAAGAVQKAKGGLGPDSELLIQVLEQVARASREDEPPVFFGSLTYEIQQLFLALERSGVESDRMASLEWAFLPTLEHGEYTPTAIYKALASSPKFFADVVRLVYKAENREASEQVSEEQSSRASRGWDVLFSWKLVPGTQDDGTIDGDQLRAWVEEVRELASKLDRVGVVDSRIGGVFAHAPVDPRDGHWPTREVRSVIEEVGTGSLRDGFRVGVFNKRGLTTKAYAEGGRQERELARRYRSWATALSAQWPLTAETLGEIADGYELDARSEDEEAEARMNL